MADRDYDLRLEKMLLGSSINPSKNSSIDLANGYSNEDLEALFNELDVEGKSVLTVGSSGDQVLNAIYYGAKKCTLYDANIFSRAVVELKMASIKGLEYEDYINYWTFSEGNESILDYIVYAKISHNLSPEIKQFWDTIMLEKDDEGKNYDLLSAIFASSSFKHRENSEGKSFPVFAYGSEFYRDKEHYDILKSKLDDCELEYIEADILDAKLELSETYDVILLSNVYDYMRENTKDFIDIVNVLESDFLNDKGKIQVHYALSGNYSRVYNDFMSHLVNKNLKSKEMLYMVGTDLVDERAVEGYYKGEVPKSNYHSTIIDGVALQKDMYGKSDKPSVEMTNTMILEKE